MSSDLSPSSAPAHVASPGEDVDPELLALPGPPRGERRWTLVLLALTAVASVAMAFALRGDATYALASSAPADIGELRDVAPAALEDNRFVRAHGMLGAAFAIRYERPFGSDSYRVSPVAGRRDLWVEVRVPAGEENARYIPPSTFAGRLVRFDASGPRHRGLRSAIASATGEAVPEGAWLLVDEQAPSSARWAVALALLFLAFAVWNVTVIAKLVRRVS